MKKWLCVLILLCMIPALTGCGSIYSNFREVEQILAIQTMGLDSRDGAVRLTLAAPSTTRTDGSPVCLSGTGQSVTTAIQRIRNYSSEDDLFCAHVNHVVLGEPVARQGIADMLTYLCRSTEMRIDTPLYVVREHTAEEMISGVVKGGTGICEVLDAVKANADDRGDSYVFTASQVMRALARHGSALICALEYSDSDELTEKTASGGSGSDSKGQDSQTQESGNQGQDNQNQDNQGQDNQSQDNQGQDNQGQNSMESPPPQSENQDQSGGKSGSEETGGGTAAPKEQEQSSEPPGGQTTGKTAAVAGYAVLKGDKLCGYIDREDAIGANFLMNLVGICDVVVPGREGEPITLEISQGSTEVVPVWDEKDGSLTGIDIYAQVSASVREAEEGSASQEQADYITGQLEAAVSERIRSVLRSSKRLQADFLGLGDRVELADPVQFRRLDASFTELLPTLTFRLSVSGNVSHINNLKDI